MEAAPLEGPEAAELDREDPADEPGRLGGGDHRIGLFPPKAPAGLAGFRLGRLELLPQGLVKRELEEGERIAFPDEGDVEQVPVGRPDEGQEPPVTVPRFGSGQERDLRAVETAEREPLGQEGH